LDKLNLQAQSLDPKSSEPQDGGKSKRRFIVTPSVCAEQLFF
jgi:hypothetical protein